MGRFGDYINRLDRAAKERLKEQKKQESKRRVKAKADRLKRERRKRQAKRIATAYGGSTASGAVKGAISVSKEAGKASKRAAEAGGRVVDAADRNIDTRQFEDMGGMGSNNRSGTTYGEFSPDRGRSSSSSSRFGEDLF